MPTDTESEGESEYDFYDDYDNDEQEIPNEFGIQGFPFFLKMEFSIQALLENDSPDEIQLLTSKIVVPRENQITRATMRFLGMALPPEKVEHNDVCIFLLYLIRRPTPCRIFRRIFIKL